jgi:hypothetical protein
VHPRRLDLHPTGRGGELTLAGVAVADHQPSAGLVTHLGVCVQVGAPLRLKRHRDHLPRRQPAQLIQIDRRALHALVPADLRTRVSVMHYSQH